MPHYTKVDTARIVYLNVPLNWIRQVGNSFEPRIAFYRFSLLERHFCTLISVAFALHHRQSETQSDCRQLPTTGLYEKVRGNWPPIPLLLCIFPKSSHTPIHRLLRDQMVWVLLCRVLAWRLFRARRWRVLPIHLIKWQMRKLLMYLSTMVNASILTCRSANKFFQRICWRVDRSLVEMFDLERVVSVNWCQVFDCYSLLRSWKSKCKYTRVDRYGSYFVDDEI